MSISESHAEVTAKWCGLPNVKNVASYNYVDQLVLFESIEAKHVAACLSLPTPAERWSLKKNVWLNGWHEYTHWLDMTSSVFGMRWLCQLVELLEKYPGAGQPPSTEFIDECKSATRKLAGIHLPEYYSTVDNPVGRPWLYSSTVGQAFDYDGNPNPNHPLWFVRFNTPDGLPIARQPISIASLLEVRAVEAELLGGFRLINALQDRAFQAIEKSYLSEDILTRLYEPYLTVYSVAAHWYANHRQVSDAGEAYRAASKLAWFCLDAPTNWVGTLKATSEFRNRMGNQFAELMNISLSLGDRGALFFMLASETRLRSLRSLGEDLSALTQAEWGVSLREVNEAGKKERTKLSNRLVSTTTPVRQLAEIWKKNSDQRTLDAPLSVSNISIQLPAVILADDTPLDIFRMRMGDQAFGNRIFDPRPYFDEFLKPHLSMVEHGSYSPNGLHCFSTARDNREQ